MYATVAACRSHDVTRWAAPLGLPSPAETLDWRYWWPCAAMQLIAPHVRPPGSVLYRAYPEVASAGGDRIAAHLTETGRRVVTAGSVTGRSVPAVLWEPTGVAGFLLGLEASREKLARGGIVVGAFIVTIVGGDESDITPARLAATLDRLSALGYATPPSVVADYGTAPEDYRCEAVGEGLKWCTAGRVRCPAVVWARAE